MTPECDDEDPIVVYVVANWIDEGGLDVSVGLEEMDGGIHAPILAVADIVTCGGFGNFLPLDSRRRER